MSIRTYTGGKSTRKTPQWQPISGARMFPNSAGGYTFPVDCWKKLDRFLILGTEGGSYYASERDLTKENVDGLMECLAADGVRFVRRLVDVSDSGRAPKNEPAIFALALALKLGNEATKREAKLAVPKVCRIGTHLFALAECVESLGGWGRGTRRAFADWYLGQDAKELAYGLIKYQARNGWSNRDVLRLSHPKAVDETVNSLLRWAVKGWEQIDSMAPESDALRQIWAFEQAKRASTAREIVRLIEEHRLPRECVPTQFLNDVKVWEALLTNGGKGMPVTAMIRSLAKMTSVGLLQPMSAASRQVVKMLGSEDVLRRARVHPLAVLMALRTYKQGRGERGSLRWEPDQSIVTALDNAFYRTFKAVEPTGKRWMLALDVSSSMTWGRVAGTPLTPREASAAMSLVTLNSERETHVIGFTAGPVTPLRIAKGDRLDDVVDYVNRQPMGGTDCALPMTYALEKRIPTDVFVIYTDSETWAGEMQPVEALARYRDRMGIPAKLIVVGMMSNDFTLADPNDGGMMDVVGFDTAAPAVMSDFARN